MLERARSTISIYCVPKSGASGDPTGCTQGSCVKQVKCDAIKGMCIAYIQGQPSKVTTDNARALGILLTAISKRKAVDSLQLNGREIARVKINVP